MRSRNWLLCVPLLYATASYGVVAEPGRPAAEYQAPGWQPAPANVKEWADRCTDSTVNGWGFKDPRNFTKLVGLFSDPAIYLEFAQRMQDPESYARMANLMLDPATAKNYLEWGDPVIYTKWMTALFDPNFLMSALRPGLEVGTYVRWASVPMDPRWWAVAFNTMNPAVWAKWMTAPVNPKVMEPLAKAADPNTALKWSQALADPGNYQGWTQWTAALQGNPGEIQANGLNIFNPGTWFAPMFPGVSPQTYEARPAPGNGMPGNGSSGTP